MNAYRVQYIANMMYLLSLCCLYVRNLCKIKCKFVADTKLKPGKPAKIYHLFASDTKSNSS